MKPSNDCGQPSISLDLEQPAAPPGGERPVLPAPGGRGHGEACLQRGQGCDGPVDAASDSETVSVQGDDVGVAQGEPGLGGPAVLAGQGEPVLGKSDVLPGPGQGHGCHEWPGHADQSQHVLHSGELGVYFRNEKRRIWDLKNNTCP